MLRPKNSIECFSRHQNEAFSRCSHNDGKFYSDFIMYNFLFDIVLMNICSMTVGRV